MRKLTYLVIVLFSVQVFAQTLNESKKRNILKQDEAAIQSVGEDVESYLNEQSDRVIDRLLALKNILQEQEIEGVQYQETSISIDASRYPEFVDINYVFELFASLFQDEDLRRIYEDKLLAKGFYTNDLIFLEELADDSWRIESTSKRRHFLEQPNREQLAEVSDEEILDFLETNRFRFIENQKKNTAHFLNKLSPHSRRVLVDAVFEKVINGNVGINYPLGYTIENAKNYRMAWQSKLSRGGDTHE